MSLRRKRELLCRLAVTNKPQERSRIRAELIEAYLPLADSIAYRFGFRGREPLEDILQVARLALVESIDRYDPHWGWGFPAFAIPTIEGAVKRHFRDTGWAVRVPRRLQELHLALTAAVQHLTQQHDRAPTAAELAEHLEISEQEAIEGLQAGSALTAVSLQEPAVETSGTVSPKNTIADTLADHDPGFERIDNHHALRASIPQLSHRTKRLLHWRFYEDLTQQQIAKRLGVSQMQVSRLLRETLNQLRQQILSDPQTHRRGH